MNVSKFELHIGSILKQIVRLQIEAKATELES